MAFLSKPDGSPISRTSFLEFVCLGMPVVIVGRIYYAYPDNIEEFIKAITLQQISDPPEKAA